MRGIVKWLCRKSRAGAFLVFAALILCGFVVMTLCTLAGGGIVTLILGGIISVIGLSLMSDVFKVKLWPPDYMK